MIYNRQKISPPRWESTYVLIFTQTGAGFFTEK
jgi:hypothetical protein